MTTAVQLCVCEECDLIAFLEWLDKNEVKRSGWKYPQRTHEESARLYLAERN